MKNVFILLIVLILTACNKISNEKLIVVNDIPLGITMKQYNDTIVGLSKTNAFQTKTFYSSTEELGKDIYSNLNSVKINYTEVFEPNLDDGFNYYGALIPIYFQGSENLIGEHVIFFRDHPLFINNFNASEKSKIYAYRQLIRKEAIDHIENLLILKYGEPTKRNIEKNYQAYVLGTDLKTVNTKNPGELLIWEKDLMNITFYKGFNSKTSTFNHNLDMYFESFGEELNLENGIEFTFDLPYLTYQLNEETIKKLKLDNLKL